MTAFSIQPQYSTSINTAAFERVFRSQGYLDQGQKYRLTIIEGQELEIWV